MKSIKLYAPAFWRVLLLSALIPAHGWAQNTPAYQPPALLESNACALVLIPDTQNYARNARNQGIYDLMTAWIAENLQTLKLFTVLHVGDLVDQNSIENIVGYHGNQPGTQQWQAISRAFERLDAKIPYINATGNHDYDSVNAELRQTQFSKYFPLERNPAWQGVFVEACPNCASVKTLENAAYALTTPTGRKLLIITLEYAPRDAVLTWARELAARDAWQNHLVILVTHAYMQSIMRNNNLIRQSTTQNKEHNDGQAIWDKLIYPSANIRLVFCGHITGIKDPRENVGFRQDKNHLGRTVSQMLFNAQTDGGGRQGNGGDGWLRILEFSADGQKVTVRTFSPLFAISPSTQHLAWRTEAYNQFVFEIDN